MPKQAKLGVFAFLALLQTGSAQFQGWQHSGSLYIITTPDGADLPATAMEEGFPLLVRLNKDWFDFRQAKPNGEDVRFASDTGTSLAYQVEEWDAAKGAASIWVRIPAIKGNERQEIKMYWGKADATNESSGTAVFNPDNGFLSVLHLDQALKDEVGSVVLTNAGTTTGTGVIGKGLHIAAGQSLGCGKITTFPTKAGANSTAA